MSDSLIWIYFLSIIPVVIWLIVSTVQNKHDIKLLEVEIKKANKSTHALEERFDKLEKNIENHLIHLENILSEKLDAMAQVIEECTKKI